MKPHICDGKLHKQEPTSKWATVTSFGIVMAALILGQVYTLKDGYFRFYSIAITFAFGLGAWLISTEQFNELKAKYEAKDVELALVKAKKKLNSEYFGLAALGAFVLTQYRAGLSLDEVMTETKITDHPLLILYQSITLIFLLLMATLAIGRKIGLAKFERYEAETKLIAAQETKESDMQIPEPALVTAIAKISTTGHTIAVASATASCSPSGTVSATASCGSTPV